MSCIIENTNPNSRGNTMIFALTHEYLDSLIDECCRQRSIAAYHELQAAASELSYLTPLKSFVVYHRGLWEQVLRKKYGITEKKTLRASCKNYLRLTRDETGRIAEIATFRNGRPECIHQCREADGKLFYLPFLPGGGFYPTYSYVTSPGKDSGVTAEEYQAEGNHIIYYGYRKNPDDNSVNFISVSYVRGGTPDILEETRGVISSDTLRYTEEYCGSWLNRNRKGAVPGNDARTSTD